MKVSLPGCFWSHEVSIAQNIEKEIDLTVKDGKGIELTIKALVTKDHGSHTIEIAFFCQAYVINETPYDYIIYGISPVLGEHSKRVAGQTDLDHE
jgi:Ni,Fe-hydrogenase maturation factor